MKMKTAFLVCTIICIAATLPAQTVVVTDDNTYTTGQASSVLDVKSTSKGFLVPRMTSAQRTAIATPTDGLLVYQTDGVKGFYYYNASAWTTLASGIGSQWTTSGNTIYYTGGNVGVGLNTPTYPLSVKDTLEIRRMGTVSQLLFTNTAGSGDLRIAGDGGDLFWQGGGGRNLQMGAYWGIILAGDRQTVASPAFSNGVANTNVLALAQRDESVPLAVQGNSTTQSANLMEWRSSSATLSVMDKNGDLGIGVVTPTADLHIKAGTAAATTAPLKFTAGTNMTTPEAGAVEFDGTNYFATSGTVRYTLAKTLTATATLDFASTAALNSRDLTVTVTGAAVGDVVAIGVAPALMLANSCYSGYVSAANTITVRFNNYSVGALNPGSGSFRVTVIKY
ncbi:MAG: hypothetical protein QM802_12405 [Agriterribacter sp.]